MQDFRDRLILFLADVRPAHRPDPEPAHGVGEPIRSAEPSPSLRPDAVCLQRWIDLSA